jgi:hypothetical protein
MQVLHYFTIMLSVLCCVLSGRAQAQQFAFAATGQAMLQRRARGVYCCIFCGRPLCPQRG